MANVQELIDTVKGMTVLELNDLVKALQEEFGVSAMAMAAPAAAAGPAAEEVEEKTTFDVILTAPGDKKIQVIKVVREIVSGLGLKEAKELVESLPAVVGDELPKDEANALKEKLEAQGAKVELS